MRTDHGAPFERWPTSAFPEALDMLRRRLPGATVDDASLGATLHRCDLTDCRGACCVDGAYLEADEPQVLLSTAQRYHEDLTALGLDLGSSVVVPGAGRRGRPGALKTAVVPTGASAPGRDRACVFRLRDGRCGLQMLSTQRGYHPWHFKPVACWMHPLDIYDEDGSTVVALFRGAAPPAGSPASVGTAPCSQKDPSGPPAHEVLDHELRFLFGVTGTPHPRYGPAP